MFYGFVVENNENDLVPLSLDMHGADPLLETKRDLLDIECSPRKLKVNEGTDDVRFDKLISYLRFVEYEGSHLYLQTVIIFSSS